MISAKVVDTEKLWSVKLDCFCTKTLFSSILRLYFHASVRSFVSHRIFLPFFVVEKSANLSFKLWHKLFQFFIKQNPTFSLQQPNLLLAKSFQVMTLTTPFYHRDVCEKSEWNWMNAIAPNFEQFWSFCPSDTAPVL